MVAKWTKSTGAGDGETPNQMILVAGRHRHVESGEEKSWLVVVESGE